jgi:hypothetical protein
MHASYVTILPLNVITMPLNVITTMPLNVVTALSTSSPGLTR